MDRRTGKVEITSQNHGFAVDAPLDGATLAPEERYGRVEVSHISLNDDVVEGLAAWTSPRSRSSTTRKPPPARTTPPTCSTVSST